MIQNDVRYNRDVQVVILMDGNIPEMHHFFHPIRKGGVNDVRVSQQFKTLGAGSGYAELVLLNAIIRKIDERLTGAQEV